MKLFGAQSLSALYDPTTLTELVLLVGDVMMLITGVKYWLRLRKTKGNLHWMVIRHPWNMVKETNLLHPSDCNNSQQQLLP